MRNFCKSVTLHSRWECLIWKCTPISELGINCFAMWFSGLWYRREAFEEYLVKMGSRFASLLQWRSLTTKLIVWLVWQKKMAVIWSLTWWRKPSISAKACRSFKITSCDCSYHCSTDAPAPLSLSTRMKVPLLAIYFSILKTQNWSWWPAKSPQAPKRLFASGIADGQRLGSKRVVMQANGKPCWVNDNLAGVAIATLWRNLICRRSSSHGCLWSKS